MDGDGWMVVIREMKSKETFTGYCPGYELERPNPLAGADCCVKFMTMKEMQIFIYFSIRIEEGALYKS